MTSLSTTFRRALFAGLAATFSCSPPTTDANKDGIADGVRNPNTITQVAPANPTGTVTGIVTTTKFVAISDANVLLVLGSGFTSAAKSGADGAFRFTAVPAGSAGQLIVSKDGFGTARVPVAVPAGTGNVPLNDGNANAGVISLLELNGSVRYLIQTPTGLPAKSVRAMLEVTPAAFQLTSGTGYGTPLGQLSYDGQADDSGTITFMNVPAPAELARTGDAASNYTLVIAGLDADGDGENEFRGLVDQRSARTFFTQGVPTLRLEDRRAGGVPTIEATNVESLKGVTSPVRNLLKPNESVYVVFDQPIQERTLFVRATQEDCSTVVPTTVTVKSNVVQITAGGNGWAIGEKHNLVVRAAGAEGGAQSQAYTGFVFGGDLANPKTPMTVAFQVRRSASNMGSSIMNGDTLVISFDTPLKQVSTAGFFQWNYDLNQMNGVSAMDHGEFGAPSGFAFSADEPTTDAQSQFTCAVSGFTKRWRGVISGLPITGIPSPTQARVVLPVVGSGQGGYQTIWGATFSGQKDNQATLLP